MATFLSSLETGILVADAVSGPAGPAEVIRSPERVAAGHAAALAAGARVLRTATRGANREGLAAAGLAGRVSEVNWTAAQLARAVARPAGALVAGAVGPCGGGPGAEAQFTEQVGALLDGGVDAVFFEGFSDASELDAALYAFRSLDCRPVLVSFRLAAGADADAMFAQWVDNGASVVELRGGDGALWRPEAVPGDGWLACRASDGLAPEAMMAAGIRVVSAD